MERGLIKRKILSSLATKYYKDLSGPFEDPTFSLIPKVWNQNEKVTEEENAFLIRQFTEEEIKNVVFTMKKTQHRDRTTYL
jgi:hypothetical protein